MPDKNPPDEAKRERARKLFDEIDPGLAKRLREKLKKRNEPKDAQDDLPPGGPASTASKFLEY